MQKTDQESGIVFMTAVAIVIAMLINAFVFKIAGELILGVDLSLLDGLWFSVVYMGLGVFYKALAT